jgi:hypothetical protein
VKAWLLAALFSLPASAAVVEPVVTVAPGAPISGAAGISGSAASMIPTVPAASVLAPSLNSAVIKAFSGDAVLAPAALPAGAVRFLPTLAPAAAQPTAPAAAAVSDSGAPVPFAPAESLPPAASASRRTIPAVPGARKRDAATERAVGALAARLDRAEGETSAAAGEAGPVERLTDDAAAGLGRRVFDRSSDRALLAEGAGIPSDAGQAFAGVSVPAAASAARLAAPGAAGSGTTPVSTDGEVLRDAVASPLPSAALSRPAIFTVPHGASADFAGAVPSAPREMATASAPGLGAASAAPRSFERLSLELGSGLVVKVRGALGMSPSAVPAAKSFSVGANGSVPASRAGTGAPVTSTEWLERRGLLEVLSASEAAADQIARAVPPRAAALVAPSARVPSPRRPVEVPGAAWALAFLPAAALLLKKLA